MDFEVFFFFLKSYACFCSIIFLAKTKNWAKIINSTTFPEKAKTLLFYSSSLYLQEFVKKMRKKLMDTTFLPGAKELLLDIFDILEL